jgi:large subunit ribosomal protein L27e
MKNVEDNNEKKHPFGHCIVAGIERYPLKVNKGMSEKIIKKRTTIKPFVKVINHNHIMPTRCVQAHSARLGSFAVP